MTLQSRNRFFKAGIVFTALAAVLIAASASVILPAYPEAAEESVRRSAGLFQSLIRARLEISPYVPFITVTGAVVYSLIGISLIYYFFEKTQAPEILYINFFVLSLAFECIRVMVPLKIALELSSMYLVMSSRILIFGRCLGLFALFAASVCAAGLEVQKQRNIIFVTIAAALVLALGIPIDGLSWDSTLNMISGYSSMFNLLETGVLFITILSFFVSAYTRGTRQYNFIALGVLLVYLGRSILLSSDTWITPGPGLLILAAGTWFTCTQLHRVYLWL